MEAGYALPPLLAVRVFEVAARHLSFTAAAQELFVTPGAVSRQVKQLEDYFEVRLFNRLARGLELTEEGHFYFRVVQQPLRQLAEGSSQLKRRGREGPLRVTLIPSFAVHWLVPRLDRFYKSRPGIDVLVDASFRSVDFSREDMDLGIRLGEGFWPGLRADLLMTFDWVPVCAPGLLEKNKPLQEPNDLARYPLLSMMTRDIWLGWLKMAGADQVSFERCTFFNDFNVMFQAALDGLGVALGRSNLVGADVAAGRLVQPFDIAFPSRTAYYVVCAAERYHHPKIAAFREWLLQEADV
ncbi:transcriptional regulator GcvA [Acanthopleuribacter pedis]|uniref:Transcriptional regulator GcvA n=1 Tax=Acanthopleuribacter pedis TaxID=442870 RepID=A0A8J7Q9J7_9BACT|nr:transcriptional regulator GcvA [Acanthopleuribacter pedis]MBO1320415.1 transcriptional regulator GcvA [Acanthopleuribacter pedis]